ncbi:MAG: hypothetical protein KAX49_01455 [Halanaerobiales bacterium]|nr:hypothetical protein [Halanaerobiales bacterium]
MKKISILLSLLLVVTIFSGSVQASADVKAMGNAPGAAATGDNGIDWNPAAINVDNGMFSLDLLILDTTLWTNSLGVYDILEYGGLVEGSDSNWNEEEINYLLDAIPSSGFSINADHTTRAKIIIGPVGISTGVTGHVRGRLDKDLFNLLLKGNMDYVNLNGEEETEPSNLLDLTDTEAYVMATADAGLSFSLPLHKYFNVTDYFDELYAGSTLHVVAGGYAKTFLTDDTKFYLGYGEADGNVQIIDIRFADNKLIKEKMAELEDGEMYPLIKAIYTSDSSHLGLGSAVDFGLLARKDNWTFGISAMNIGSIKFNEYNTIEYGLVKDDNPDNPIGGNLTSEPVYGTGTEEIVEKLPSKINIGASYKLDRWLLLGVQASRTNVAKGLSYSEIGAGLEFNPIWVLPMRVGIIHSFAKNSNTLTGGFGLHFGPFKTDITGAVDTKSVSIGLNTSLEF